MADIQDVLKTPPRPMTIKLDIVVEGADSRVVGRLVQQLASRFHADCNIVEGQEPFQVKGNEGYVRATVTVTKPKARRARAGEDPEEQPPAGWD